jgi:hypothetical protein
MLGLAAGLGVLRTGAVQMSAKMEAILDLFIEQTFGAVVGMALMAAFEVAREDGVPAEALVLEMYMSGEMEAVFKGFRESGFFRASEDHGPSAVFGGITRTMAMDRRAMTDGFREVLKDIKSGGFARRFQEEGANGYPMLKFAAAFMHAPSPIALAEERIRNLVGMSPDLRQGPEMGATGRPSSGDRCSDGDTPGTGIGQDAPALSEAPGGSPSPSTGEGQPISREAKTRSAGGMTAGSGSWPSVGGRRSASWPVRLIRAPGYARQVWKHAAKGTPWRYKLVFVGVHLKAMLTPSRK